MSMASSLVLPVIRSEPGVQHVGHAQTGPWAHTEKYGVDKAHAIQAHHGGVDPTVQWNIGGAHALDRFERLVGRKVNGVARSGKLIGRRRWGAAGEAVAAGPIASASRCLICEQRWLRRLRFQWSIRPAHTEQRGIPLTPQIRTRLMPDMTWQRDESFTCVQANETQTAGQSFATGCEARR